MSGNVEYTLVLEISNPLGRIHTLEHLQLGSFSWGIDSFITIITTCLELSSTSWCTFLFFHKQVCFLRIKCFSTFLYHKFLIYYYNLVPNY